MYLAQEKQQKHLLLSYSSIGLLKNVQLLKREHKDDQNHEVVMEMQEKLSDAIEANVALMLTRDEDKSTASFMRSQ